MRISRKTLWLAGAGAVAFVAVYAGSTALALRHRDARIQREAEFTHIGKKVVDDIHRAGRPPINRNELMTNGWLLADEVEFLRKNDVAYFPAGATGRSDEVVLRMPYEGDTDMLLQSDGSMRKEKHQ